MYEWLKKNRRSLIVYVITIGTLIFIYACEPRVRSLNESQRFVNRAELEAEFNAYIDKYDLRFASLDRQDKIRAIILNNAMIVVQGQPFNPIGLLTAMLSVYGITQAAKNTTGAIQNVKRKRTSNKSPTT